MRLWKAGILGLGLCASGLSLAKGYDFSHADSLFAKRAEGKTDDDKFASAMEARKAYEKIYENEKNLSDEDLIHILNQRTRLDLWIGGALEGISKGSRKKALKNCIALGKDLKSSLKDRQEAHYSKLACLSLLAKISNLIERATLAHSVKNAVAAALKASEVNGTLKGGFEGGGILRVIAGVKANIKAKAVGLYDPEHAHELIEIALQTPKTIYDPYPEPLSGKDYYENFYYKGYTLTSLGMQNNSFESVEQGYTLLKNTIQAINDLEEAQELPRGREPEILHYRHIMRNVKQNIDDCRGERWNSCLESNLGKESKEEGNKDERDEL